MPCPSKTFTGTRIYGSVREVFSRRRELRYSEYWIPNSLEELVLVTGNAKAQNKKLKPVGSAWAFEGLCESDDWGVSLEKLKKDLTRSTAPNCVVNESALLPPLWASLLAGKQPTVAQFEGGIQIFEVATQLEASGYSLPTLGGANNQTFIGAASTSTHGGDFESPPLPDLIRAIHLVCDGGREVWIESSSRPVTTPTGLKKALSCKDVEVIRDDSVLRAAVVGLGRFGVIYSFVVDVVPMLSTIEVSVRVPFAQAIAALNSSVASGAPFSAWLPIVRASLAASGLTSTELSIVNSKPASFIQMIVPSRGSTECVLQSRWHMTGSLPPLNEVGIEAPGLCGPSSKAEATAEVRAAFGLAISTAFGLATSSPALAPLVPVPLVGEIAATVGLALSIPIEEARNRWEARVGSDRRVQSGAEVLVAALRECWDLPLADKLITQINQDQILGSFDSSQGKRGRHWIITSGAPALGANPCWRGDSMEFIFPSNTTAFISFINTISAAGAGFKQAGYISLRFCRPSQATLSMHNLPSPYVASVEVASIADSGDFGPWMNFLQPLALSLGGRPHWGQMHQLTAGQVARLYGPSLTAWREALLRLNRNDRTFMNAFTTGYGLEPAQPQRRVTGALRDATERITHLGSMTSAWPTRSVSTIIDDINLNKYVYYTYVGDRLAVLKVIDTGGVQVLRADIDDTPSNDLENLPDLPPVATQCAELNQQRQEIQQELVPLLNSPDTGNDQMAVASRKERTRLESALARVEARMRELGCN